MPRKRKQPEMAPPPPETRRITPVDIQQKEFRVGFRGYTMGEVDAFLDEVTEEVARLYADNKRLREDAEFGRTSRLETSGAAEADAIVRQAREEAARLIAEATARASAIGAASAPSTPSQPGPAPAPAGPSTEIMGIFLARERAFLQNMANLIQAHAEGVKQDVRRVRERPAQPAHVEQSRPAEVSGDIAGQTPPVEAQEAVRPTGAAEEAQPREPARAEERVVERESEPAASQDIVDLTRETEPVAEDRADAVLSPVPEGTSARNVEEASGLHTAPSTRPGVEEDDTKEDRSIRELFWGED
jgi:DivIVA domain-containing protein